ncbi:hypothetical protein FGB62_3g243 [Gracilaria domingensis]|nr:hypothetical protein FGB62_3g243 [Gracilaria domingensis]
MLLASRLRSRSECHPSSEVQTLASQPLPTAPPREIDAARIAALDALPTELVLERARLVSQAPSRMPYIAIYGKYNKRWYVDIVTLPHNALRCLVSNVFELLAAAHRLALDMTESDFQQLFTFLAEFDHFARVVFDAEQKILFPEVEPALKKRTDYNTHALHPNLRATTISVIHALLDKLTDKSLNETPSLTVIHILQTTMDKLSTTLLDYFAVKETVLPRILFRSYRGAKEKNRMEARLIKFFEEANHQYYYTALLTLPLNNEQVRLDFEERHFAKPNHRQQYRDAVSIVQTTLTAIPTQFQHAARQYEQRFSMKTFVEKYGTDRDHHVTTHLVENASQANTQTNPSDSQVSAEAQSPHQM